MSDLQPLTSLAQLHDDVLFVDAGAPAQHLFEAAERRLVALEDLLCLLADCPDEMPLVQGQARLVSALLPMAAEARQLYQLAQDRR
ncbi:hypothetical protein SAMN05216189_101382 [Pseudomonas delhiensis]|uniref:Uncharacterized protein n=1 Tax=Pseudomonas delhiensis TaxID=366289 RepID=A0A239KJX2_9PSED|nr:hypothetical protein [Pseudomonas delhiensis]SDJ16158.1 hypothetical protein SAMN05216189_101382 [Pseudomonas delhiensis]SNT18290.1 hypothetical protein SAMN06295949_11666 [Pseudomonas delhiensis]